MKSHTTLICLISSSLLAASTSLAQEKPATSDPEQSDLLHQEIETMRLVIANSISEKFNELLQKNRKEKQETSSEFETDKDQDEAGPEPAVAISGGRTPWSDGDDVYVVARNAWAQSAGRSQFTSNTRAFYVPSQGMIVTTAVSIPLSVVDRSTGEVQRDDAWERARKELSGKSSAYGNRKSSKVMVTDALYVAALEDIIVDTVGRYGHKLTTLLPSDNIVIALRLNPDHNSFSDAVEYFAIYTGGASGVVPSHHNAERSAKTQNMIIQIPVQCVRDLANGTLRADQFKAKVRTSRFDIASDSWSFMR